LQPLLKPLFWVHDVIAHEIAVPPRLAAVWFGPSERNMASSIGVVANNVGSAIP
jgi:hypothetical protein